MVTTSEKVVHLKLPLYLKRLTIHHACVLLPDLKLNLRFVLQEFAFEPCFHKIVKYVGIV